MEVSMPSLASGTTPMASRNTVYLACRDQDQRYPGVTPTIQGAGPPNGVVDRGTVSMTADRYRFRREGTDCGEPLRAPGRGPAHGTATRPVRVGPPPAPPDARRFPACQAPRNLPPAEWTERSGIRAGASGSAAAVPPGARSAPVADGSPAWMFRGGAACGHRAPSAQPACAPRTGWRRVRTDPPRRATGHRRLPRRFPVPCRAVATSARLPDRWRCRSRGRSGP